MKDRLRVTAVSDASFFLRCDVFDQTSNHILIVKWRSRWWCGRGAKNEEKVLKLPLKLFFAPWFWTQVLLKDFYTCSGEVKLNARTFSPNFRCFLLLQKMFCRVPDGFNACYPALIWRPVIVCLIFKEMQFGSTRKLLFARPVAELHKRTFQSTFRHNREKTLYFSKNLYTCSTNLRFFFVEGSFWTMNERDHCLGILWPCPQGTW